MADYDSQLSMFPGDEGGEGTPRERLLFHVLRMQAEAVRAMAAINQDLVSLEKAREARNGTQHATFEPRTEHRHRPHLKELRTWEGFCAYYQHLERIVRSKNQLGPDDEVSKEMLYAAGGQHPRTTTRIMVETYGLEPDQWPPSTWPSRPPAA